MVFIKWLKNDCPREKKECIILIMPVLDDMGVQYREMRWPDFRLHQLTKHRK